MTDQTQTIIRDLTENWSKDGRGVTATAISKALPKYTVEQVSYRDVVSFLIELNKQGFIKQSGFDRKTGNVVYTLSAK